MRIPDFLVRQFYVPGSLRNEADGFSLQATNPIGDGTLVGIGRISVDGRVVDPAAVSATRADRAAGAGDAAGAGGAVDTTGAGGTTGAQGPGGTFYGRRLRASDVTRRAPVAFRRGDVVTFHVAGPPLAPGSHAFEVEVFELNMGRLLLALTDTIAPNDIIAADRAPGG